MSILELPTARAYQPLLGSARYKGAKGGRGSGKSHFFADCWLDENLRLSLDFVCLREVQKDLKFSVKKLLESKIETHNAGAYFDAQDRQIIAKRIDGAVKGVTIFEGMQNHTADSIKSLEKFKRAWFEEAHRASQRSLDLLRPTLREDDSELWFSWNPELATDPIDALLCGEVKPPRSVVVHATYADNPWLSNALREEMEYDRSRDPDKFAHIWLGQYQRNSESRVFKNWRIEEFESPAGATFRLGADWGFAVDPSVLVRCHIDGHRLYVDYEAYMVRCEIDKLPELFMSVPDAERWVIVADSARPETINYMRRHGFPKIVPAVKGARSLEEGVEFLQSFDIIVHPRCKHLIDELSLYSYEVDKLTGHVLPKLADKDNHVIDAIRYACEGARRAGLKPKKKEIKPMAVPSGPQAFLGA